MGTYTPNYNLYMPEVGETGWGQLVSNNFAILDGLPYINSITTTFTVLTTTTVNIDSSYITYDSTTLSSYAYIYGSTSALIPSGITITPSQSCRYFLIYINGDLTINGNIDMYPTSLLSELPPNSPETNTLDVYRIGDLCNSLTTLISKTGTAVTMDIQEPYLGAYLDFYSRKIGITTDVIANIPHAIAAGGVGNKGVGTAGTAENTCNGGGGGSVYGNNTSYTGGTGCIFGQYAGSGGNGYGYGSGASAKYRCGLIFIINGNLTINESCTITQVGGDSDGNNGGYGGGAGGFHNGVNGTGGGGGGAPVFIYYTGTYVNNGTINTAGGTGEGYGGNGGAGGIKTTKISI